MTLSSNCESCSTPHDGTYGSGRFCSSKCARGFATKGKRQEINERVAKTLTGRPTGRTISPDHKAKLRAAHRDHYASIPFDELGKEAKRLRVIADQDSKCNGCDLSEWRGQPLVLELEHKDGDNRNDARDNLECLCPNCHSLTPTWRGRNIRLKGRALVTDDQMKSALRASENIHQALGSLGLPQKGNSYNRAKRLLSEVMLEDQAEIGEP